MRRSSTKCINNDLVMMCQRRSCLKTVLERAKISKRHKKYVKLNNGERVTASGKVKTEGSAKVKFRKTGYPRDGKNDHTIKSLSKAKMMMALLKNLPVWEEQRMRAI